MTEDVENLVLGHTKRFQASLDRVEHKVDQCIVRIASLEGHVAQLHTDVAGLHVRLDDIGQRTERIERRLDPIDSAE